MLGQLIGLLQLHSNMHENTGVHEVILFVRVSSYTVYNYFNYDIKTQEYYINLFNANVQYLLIILNCNSYFTTT